MYRVRCLIVGVFFIILGRSVVVKRVVFMVEFRCVIR